jgi:hypothetical protein
MGKIANGYISKRGNGTFEHRDVAERVLGRALIRPEEVHHVNGDKTDNSATNIVICPDRAYHMLIHQREDALKASGHADWLKCPVCKTYDDPKNLRILERAKRPGQKRWYHAPRCV